MTAVAVVVAVFVVELVSSGGWLTGLGCDEAGEAGDTGSVMSLLLLQEDASEHTSDATPLKL